MELLSHYDYFLPKELIATYPLSDRAGCRLLVLRSLDQKPQHDYFANIGQYLHSGDLLVVNNTKVRKARIMAYKASGGRVDILLVRPLREDAWVALINGKGPFLPSSKLYLAKDGKDFITILNKSSNEPGSYEIACDIDLGQYAEQHGELPLPPYMGRRAQAIDDVNYQTVYAKVLGAVAAPTAGLHFTNELLKDLAARDIETVETTLHVGPGTFLPIRTENIADHKMHAEFFSMDEACAQKLNQAKKERRRIIAVGSTAMRALEQAAQWSPKDASEHLFSACQGQTSIFIRPGYEFLACDAIITNFHLPRSTLLLLVSAVASRERILQAYQEAIAQKYRFFSYGDACLLEIRK